jgi:GDP-4-dehydro-6-deoxy-D-mannose reductase
VGSGESHAVQDVLEILLSRSKVPIEVQPDPSRMRPSDVPESVSDVSRIRERTGWQAAIPFEQSLHDILEYWREETRKKLVDESLG